MFKNVVQVYRFFMVNQPQIKWINRIVTKKRTKMHFLGLAIISRRDKKPAESDSTNPGACSHSSIDLIANLDFKALFVDNLMLGFQMPNNRFYGTTVSLRTFAFLDTFDNDCPFSRRFAWSGSWPYRALRCNPSDGTSKVAESLLDGF